MYELNHDLKLFSRFDKLFKSDLSKRYRFLIFFEIRKIFFGFSSFGFRNRVLNHSFFFNWFLKLGNKLRELAYLNLNHCNDLGAN